MMHKLEMELMILGFLSFGLVMSNEYNLPWIPNESWFHAFEFAHILLFYAACGLMLRAVIMRRALRKLVKNMDRLEREDIRVTLDKFIASTEQKQDLATRIKLGVFGSTDSNPRWDLAWQIMRKVVPRKPGFRDRQRAREVDDDFDFARYCELILQRDIVQSVHIPGPIWAVLGVIGFIVTLASMDFDQPLDTSGTGPVGANVAGTPPAGSSPCNTALPVSDDFAPPAVAGAAAAEFGDLSATNLVSGVVTFSQETETAGAVMAIDLHWVSAGDLAWHIHEKPVNALGECGASSTGNHYIPECTTAADWCSPLNCPSTPLADRTGELSARVGDLCNGLSTCLSADDQRLFATVAGCGADGRDCLNPNGGVTGNPTQRQIVRLPADNIIRLSGQNTVIGRSIVIHGADGARIACATIEPAAGQCEVPPQTGQEGDAVATFTDAGMTFSMMFTETDSTGCAGGSYTVITMRVNGAASGLPATVGGWHVHESPRGAGATTAEACANDATGAHYDPECFGTDHPAAIGELTHRHGPLRSDMADGTTWIDSHLPLRGPNSIVGRSIVIHGADGARIACATIEVGQGAGRRHLASNASSAHLEAVRHRPPTVAYDAEPPLATGNRDARGTPRPEMTGVSEMRRRLAAGSEMMYMPVEDARGTVLVIVSFCWITTILLHVILYTQHVEMVKLLKYRGWQSDDADVLRACVDNLVSAKQLRDTAIEIEHGAPKGDDHAHGGHVHDGHSHGLCAMSGYTAKERASNFFTDTLICLNCFYSAFCLLYGLYVTAWADFGWAGQFFLNVFLFVPAGYQFLALGPSIARDRAMLTAYIHVDEELLREVEVYTARTLEIKATLCEDILQKLDEAGQLDGLSSSALSDDERARKAAEFFFEAGVDQNADGALGPDELEAAIVGLRLQVTHREIKQLVRELDVDQNGLIARQELEDFLKINMTKTAIALNKAAAKTRRGYTDHGQRREEAQDGGMDTQELLEQLNEESRKSQRLEAELRQMKEENARAGGVSRRPPPALSTLSEPQTFVQAGSTPTRSPAPAPSTVSEPQTYGQAGSTPTRSPATPVRAKRAPPPLPAKSVVFSQYDKDSSGSLDAAEVRALLRARGITPAAADQILAKYDQNGDGALSQQEFDGLYAQLAAQVQRTAPRAVRAGSRRQAAMTGQSSRI